MTKFETNIWYNIDKDGSPPYDTLVLVSGEKEIIDYTGKSHGFTTVHALAYNNCYRPEISMTQVLELSEEDRERLDKVYVHVPFDIKKWMII